MFSNSFARRLLTLLTVLSSSLLLLFNYFIQNGRGTSRARDWLDHHGLEAVTSRCHGPESICSSNEEEGQLLNWEEVHFNITSSNKIQPNQPEKTKLQGHAPYVFNSDDINRIPVALRPLAHYDECCQLNISSSTKHTKNPCHNVCFTEQACTDDFYPFQSLQQRERFTRQSPRNNRDNSEKRKLCHDMNKKLKPPIAWCRQWLNHEEGHEGVGEATMGNSNSSISHEHAYEELTEKTSPHQFQFQIDPVSAGLPPPGCSAFSEGGGSGSYQHLILFPQVKLAFCGIPKVGITQWLQFLRFTLGARDYLSSPHAKPDAAAFRFDKLRGEMQKEILNDPEWKFAAFLRDPAERLLSAYLDKVANPVRAESMHFKSVYGLTHDLTFEEFVNILSEENKSCPYDKSFPQIERLRGLNWCSNPHWRPQVFSCGLSEFLPRFSFIGSLNFIDNQSRTLLREVDLWESHGKYYHWTTDKRNTQRNYCHVHPPDLKEGDVLMGFQQSPADGENRSQSASNSFYGHAKNSRSKMELYYHSPDLLQKVKNLYKEDYKLWDLIRESKRLSSGSELAAKISGTCREKSEGFDNIM